MHFHKKENRRKRPLTKEEEKFIKFSAYDALIEFDAKDLPVFPDFCQIIDSTIFIFPMQFVAEKEGHAEDYFSAGGSGVVMYVRETGHYIILYDEQLDSEQIRWTLSKLVYYIKSGNLESCPNIFHYADHGDSLEHCTAFAYQFTCPDIVLHECGIQEANEIIKLCQIPFSYANMKSRLLKMATNSKSLQFAEKILKNNFSEYISQIRQKTGLFDSPSTNNNSEYFHELE